MDLIWFAERIFKSIHLTKKSSKNSQKQLKNGFIKRKNASISGIIKSESEALLIISKSTVKGKGRIELFPLPERPTIA